MQTPFQSLLNISANIIKIDPYDFELYRLKIGSFLRHSVDLHCERQNCSPRNVLLSDVQISLKLLGVHPLEVCNQNTGSEKSENGDNLQCVYPNKRRVQSDYADTLRGVESTANVLFCIINHCFVLLNCYVYCMSSVDNILTIW